MKAWIWLRVLAGVFVLFAAGHTMGTLRPPSAAPAAAVLETMRTVRFPAMGFDRSYGEFYRGFGLFVTAEFLTLAVLAFQLSELSRRSPRQARPMAATLMAACLVSAVLSWAYFFAAPIAMSLIALAVAGGAYVMLAREARAAA
jgi:hypothetical protein